MQVKTSRKKHKIKTTNREKRSRGETMLFGEVHAIENTVTNATDPELGATKMYHALKALLTSYKLRSLLEVNDPQAYKQAWEACAYYEMTK